MRKTKRKFLSLLTCIVMTLSLLSALQFSVYAENSESADNIDSSEQTEDAAPVISDTVSFVLPSEMRAVELAAGRDYYTEEMEQEALQAQIDGIINDLISWDINTVILDTTYESKNYYLLDSENDPLEVMINSARAKGMNVFLFFELSSVKSDGQTLQQRINTVTTVVHRITSAYRIDGIIIDGYYNEKSSENYYMYSAVSEGMTFDEWLLSNNAYTFDLIYRSIRATSNSVAVGISISNMWANSDTDERGSATADEFQAYYDGYADTLDYIQNGCSDFIYLKATGSLTDYSLPLETVVSWWNGVSDDAEIPLYCSHANDKIGSSSRGWSMYDQIVKQLDAIKDYTSYAGSAFRSYSALKTNLGTSTDLLVKYFGDNIDMESLDVELTMVSPTQYTYTTYDPTVKFQGSFDENFEILFNGTPIKLNDAGNFYYERELSVGVNTFTISNKGKTLVYKITRKVKVLNSVTPGSGDTMYVEEKSRINVTVEAYKGSSVSATLNGKTIYLTEQEGATDGLDENSAYAKFTGYFTAPDGIIGEEQDLGEIVINGGYGGSYEAIYGGEIMVNALPEPLPDNGEIYDTPLVRVKNDNAITYNYYTTDNIADPDSPRLPKGTLDYYVKTVTYYLSDEGSYKAIDYYLTASGKRLRATDCEIIDGSTFGGVNLNSANSYTSGSDTYVSLGLDQQIPFTISYSPCSYYTGVFGDYFINSFAATQVNITFDYLTSAGYTPQFSGGLFSSASWSTVSVNGETKYRLTLNLKQAGIYAGVTPSYDGNGTLLLRFNGYPSSIQGAVIVIDPGHGYSRSSTVFDPGSVGHVTEQKVNLAMAKTLAEKLRNAGATVYVLPTDTTYINVYKRAEYVRTNYMPDLFLSIHCNGVVNGEGVRGVETHYFTPFSREIAGLISSNMAKYYQGVYGDGKNRDRGAYWNYFAVTLMHDFPSLLIECGFVTDSTEAMVLANSTHQSGLCDAIVNAIDTYFSRNTTS